MNAIRPFDWTADAELVGPTEADGDASAVPDGCGAMVAAPEGLNVAGVWPQPAATIARSPAIATRRRTIDPAILSAPSKARRCAGIISLNVRLDDQFFGSAR